MPLRSVHPRGEKRIVWFGPGERAATAIVLVGVAGGLAEIITDVRSWLISITFSGSIIVSTAVRLWIKSRHKPPLA